MAKTKLYPSIDYKKCMACRVCVTSCPFSCLDDVKTDVDSYGKAYPVLISKATCTSCGICAKECPIEVIVMVE